MCDTALHVVYYRNIIARYSSSSTPQGLPALSFGIWKSV
jgi:hypothetical protein